MVIFLPCKLKYTCFAGIPGGQEALVVCMYGRTTPSSPGILEITATRGSKLHMTTLKPEMEHSCFLGMGGRPGGIGGMYVGPDDPIFSGRFPGRGGMPGMGGKSFGADFALFRKVSCMKNPVTTARAGWQCCGRSCRDLSASIELCMLSQ